MVNENLSFSYLKRAKIRLKTLVNFFEAGDYPDVIRESQEVVELLQKAILIYMGIDPPKWHDVGNIIVQYKEKITEETREHIQRLVKDSQWLRSHRELSFYGAMDFIPEEFYTKNDALKAIEIAEKYLDLAEKNIKSL